MNVQLVAMNTSGVALASKSAFTNNEKQQDKEISKLFSISKEHAIGVMVYGTASMFQTPWVLRIQNFNNKLDGPLHTVYDYAEKFLQFLNQSEKDGFMAEANEIVYAETALYSAVIELNNDLAAMKSSIYSDEYMELPHGEFQKIYLRYAEELMTSRIQHMDEKLYPIGYSVCDYNLLFGKYAEKVTKLIYGTISFHLYENKWLEKMKHLIISSFIKEFFNKSSDIIFTGYGEKEKFPSLCVLSIDGKLNYKTKYHIRRKSVSNLTPGVLLAFQERKPMNSFRAYETTQMEHENLPNPILDYIKFLPAAELADLSKSLLEAEGLKKKYLEFVGTPSDCADVAMITKEEGFKWIRRT